MSAAKTRWGREALTYARRHALLEHLRARRDATIRGDHAEARRLAVELYGDAGASWQEQVAPRVGERLRRRWAEEDLRALYLRALQRAGWSGGAVTEEQIAEAVHLILVHRPGELARLLGIVGEDWIPAGPATELDAGEAA